jgi:hypothetical protein
MDNNRNEDRIHQEYSNDILIHQVFASHINNFVGLQ